MSWLENLSKKERLHDSDGIEDEAHIEVLSLCRLILILRLSGLDSIHNRTHKASSLVIQPRTG